jgi:hypothetical protein
MICPACGSRNPRTLRVCETCGAILSEVPKTQFKYEQQTVLADTAAPTGRKAETMSMLSLGLASLTPATFLAGIPAIILAIIALKQHRPGRSKAITGLVTGVIGTLVLTFVLFLPLVAWQQDVHRVAVVKQRMAQYRAALEDFATESNGRYPKEGISWEKEDDDGMVKHFKGRGQLLAAGGSRKPGAVDELKLHYRDEDRPLTGIPFNPYTRERYRTGKDFFYLTEYLTESGLNAVTNRADPRCPFVGLAAPGGVPGTVVIVGWSPPEHPGSPTEYAIVGYGRNTAEPLTGRHGRVFHVLHN